jgi:thiol-disulfide isomerase/thioredoxin
MTIIGDLKNCPNGTIYLVQQNVQTFKRTNVDSTILVDGKFLFKKSVEDPLSFYSFNLVDKEGNKLLFHFKTNKTYNSGNYYSENFMPADSVLVTGKIQIIEPKNMVLPSKIKLVYPDTLIVAGKQTDVMFTVSLPNSKEVSDDSFQEIANTISKYNFSYYLLDEVYNNRGNFTKEQINTLIKLFDKEVQTHGLVSQLKKSLELRNGRSLTNVSFISSNGKLEKLHFSQSKLTMIILWASWCGPCRKEIPSLKQLHEEFPDNSELNMVSISVDRDSTAWRTALLEEKMSWNQLILPENLSEYTIEIFKHNGSIPATLFLNSRGEILEKFSGFDETTMNKYRKLIQKNLVN